MSEIGDSQNVKRNNDSLHKANEDTENNNLHINQDAEDSFDQGNIKRSKEIEPAGTANLNSNNHNDNS